MEFENAQPLLPQPDLIFDGLPFTRADGRANDLDGFRSPGQNACREDRQGQRSFADAARG